MGNFSMHILKNMKVRVKQRILFSGFGILQLYVLLSTNSLINRYGSVAVKATVLII